MAADILLRPDNRSLDQAIGDFGHYGVQSGTTVTANADLAVELPADQRIDLAFDARVSAGTDISIHPVAPALNEVQPAAPSTSDLASAPGFTPAPAASEADEALVPSATGGSTPPALLLAPEPISTLSSQNLQDTHGDTAPTVASTLNPSAIDLAALDPTTAFTLDTLGGVAHATTGAVGIVAGGLVNDVVTPVAAGAVDTIGDVAEATATVADAVVEPLAGTLDTVSDVDVADLAGADPAAGIATLVDMVSSESLFDLRDAGSAPEAMPAATSAIDTLVGDAAEAAPLLGDVAHHSESTADDLYHGLGL